MAPDVSLRREPEVALPAPPLDADGDEGERGPGVATPRPGDGSDVRRLSVVARVLASLGALVVLIVGLTVVEAGRASDRVDAGARIDSTTTEIARLLDLASVVDRERAFVIGRTFVDRFGQSTSLVRTFTGVDIDGELARARADADALVASLGAASPLTPDALAAARARGGPGLAEAVAAVGRARDDRTNRLRALVAEVGASSGLGPAVDDLADVGALAPEIVTQTFATLDVMVALDDRPLSERVQAVLLARATVRQLLDGLAARTNAVGAAARDLRDATSYRQVDELSAAQVDSHLAQGPAAPVGVIELLRLSDVWRGAFANLDRTSAVTSASVAELRAATRRVTASGRGQVAWSLAVLGAALLLSVLCVLWLVRTVVQPIVALERHARELSAGNPPDAPLGLQGARETRVAAAAMNRLVEALQVVERQASALAAGDVDDPVLARHLPGRLGAALSGAVGRLSSSIATSRAVTERLAFEATHDGLTQLPNRRAALSALEAATLRPAPTGRVLAALFVDLDGFKPVNDRHGHEAGDLVLQTVGRRLEATVREGDLVARLGGDEFLILADDLDGRAEIDALCRRVTAVVEAPIAVGQGVTVTVGASIGVATHGAGQAPDELLREADRAMYAAKAASRPR